MGQQRFTLFKCNFKIKQKEVKPWVGFPRWLSGKESACNAGDWGLLAPWKKSCDQPQSEQAGSRNLHPDGGAADR